MLNNNCLTRFIAGSFIAKNNQKEKQYCLSTSICLTPFLMCKDSFQTETVSRFAMANSFFEKRLQRIKVFVFINTNHQYKYLVQDDENNHNDALKAHLMGIGRSLGVTVFQKEQTVLVQLTKRLGRN